MSDQSHGFVIERTGGPEVLSWRELSLHAPGRGEVLLRQTVVGFNFIDIYHRTGRYPLTLPSQLGMEAAGVIEAVGPEVTSLKVGSRAVYKMQLGAYAERRLVAADELVAIPKSISDEVAVATFTKGLTAEFLLRRVHKVGAGEQVLVHAAAGGVGCFLTQWAKHLGAIVIGVVSSDAKAEIAAANGCDFVINSTTQNVVERVKAATAGVGVDVVYDSVGRTTFDISLQSLRPRGLFVSFGSASGLLELFDLNTLPSRGAPFLTRASLVNYYQTREDLVQGARQVFGLISDGIVKPSVGWRYPLEDASQCHADAEARRHSGSVILTTRFGR